MKLWKGRWRPRRRSSGRGIQDEGSEVGGHEASCGDDFGEIENLGGCGRFRKAWKRKRGGPQLPQSERGREDREDAVG